MQRVRIFMTKPFDGRRPERASPFTMMPDTSRNGNMMDAPGMLPPAPIRDRAVGDVQFAHQLQPSQIPRLASTDKDHVLF